MDFLTGLLDYDSKKSLKKDIYSEEIYVEILLERSIKWLGIFSLTLAVIAQLMNEVSGTDMKCFLDKNGGFANGSAWMKDQKGQIAKAFGDYADVHCATAMVDFGPLRTTNPTAKYTRHDIDNLANGITILPYKRCLESKDDEEYCKCEAQWEDNGKKGQLSCAKRPNGPVKSGDGARLKSDAIKYRERMFHHYLAWYLLMQTVFILVPQLIWNGIFGGKILRKFLRIHDCAQAPPGEELDRNKQLVDSLKSLETPIMTVGFFLKQVYYFIGCIVCAYNWKTYVGAGIQENANTRCLIEEYAFLICASPANGSIYFIFVIDLVVLATIAASAAFNVTMFAVKRARLAHLETDYLKKFLDKVFATTADLSNELHSIQAGKYSDYPFFSRLFQENKHIFSYVTNKTKNEVVREQMNWKKAISLAKAE